jgi:hypothetical protein
MPGRGDPRPGFGPGDNHFFADSQAMPPPRLMSQLAPLFVQKRAVQFRAKGRNSSELDFSGAPWHHLATVEPAEGRDGCAQTSVRWCRTYRAAASRASILIVKIRQLRNAVDLKMKFSKSAPDHRTEAQAARAVFSSRLALTVVSSEIRLQIRSRSVGHFSRAVAQVGRRIKESLKRSNPTTLHPCEGSEQALGCVMMAEACGALVLVAEGIVAGVSDCLAGRRSLLTHGYHGGSACRRLTCRCRWIFVSPARDVSSEAPEQRAKQRISTGGNARLDRQAERPRRRDS